MRYPFLYSLLIIVLCLRCDGQHKHPAGSAGGPLNCDTVNGICVIPGAKQQGTVEPAKRQSKALKLVYFTDPICSACWCIEPQLRKLELVYGDNITIEYYMGGLLPSWEGFNGGGISKPSDVSHHWDDMSRHCGMPLAGDVWIADPLPSSYPPSIAYKAAQNQDKTAAKKFLRNIRELVFVEQKNICRWENISKAATQAGLDTAKLRSDYNGVALQAFRSDLEMAGRYGVRGFPAIYLSDTLGNQLSIYGMRPFGDFESTVLKLLPGASKKAYDKDVNSLLDTFGSLTAQELSILAEITPEQALSKLNELESKRKVSSVSCKNGKIFRKK